MLRKPLIIIAIFSIYTISLSALASVQQTICKSYDNDDYSCSFNYIKQIADPNTGFYCTANASDNNVIFLEPEDGHMFYKDGQTVPVIRVTKNEFNHLSFNTNNATNDSMMFDVTITDAANSKASITCDEGKGAGRTLY